jgi:hypothetical protein
MCQITEAVTNMPNSGSAHKYAKSQKRSQLCQITESRTFCQITEALTNLPLPSYVAITNVPKYRGAHKSRYAVPADSVCEAAEQDGPDQKAKH